MSSPWPLLALYVLPLAGLFFFRRGGRAALSLAAASWLVAFAALGSLVASAETRAVAFLFYTLSVASVLAAFLVVTGRSPVYGALSLVATFLGIAGVFVLLEAEFFGVVQVILYVGAILVLYLFVVMMVDLPKETAERRLGARWIAAVGVGLAILVIVVQVIWPLGSRVPRPTPMKDAYSVQAVGSAIFGAYLVPFEVASLLLLAALVGAIVLCKKDAEPEREG